MGFIALAMVICALVLSNSFDGWVKYMSIKEQRRQEEWDRERGITRLQ